MLRGVNDGPMSVWRVDIHCRLLPRSTLCRHDRAVIFKQQTDSRLDYAHKLKQFADSGTILINWFNTENCLPNKSIDEEDEMYLLR